MGGSAASYGRGWGARTKTRFLLLTEWPEGGPTVWVYDAVILPLADSLGCLYRAPLHFSKDKPPPGTHRTKSVTRHSS